MIQWLTNWFLEPVIREIKLNRTLIMPQIDDLNTSVAACTAAVNTLVAAAQAASHPVDLTDAIAAVNAITASANAESAILNPPPSP